MFVVNNRIAYLDIAKGILTSLVVFHHIAFQANIAGINNGCIQWNFTFLPLYSSWFMPAFFIITGFCSNFLCSYKSFIKKNIATLFWPMICFYLLVSLFQIGTLTVDRVLKDLSIGINWFLVSLFFSKNIYFFLLNYVKRTRCRIICLVALSIAAIFCNDINFLNNNWLHYRHALYLTIFLEIGHFLKNNKQLFDIAIKFSWVAFFVIFFACQYLEIEVPGIAGLWINFNVYSLPLHLLMSILGSCMILGLSKQIGNCRPLEFIGINSLVFYLFHAFVLGIIVKTVVNIIIDPHNTIEAFIFNSTVFVSTIIICSLIAILLKFSIFSWIIKMPNNI